MNRKLILPILIILAAAISGVFAFGNSGGALRPYLVFAFILVCPGLSLVRLIKMNGFLPQWVLAIALSLVLGVTIAEAMVLTRLWSPNTELAILIFISLIGAIFQIRNALSAGKVGDKAI